MNTTDNAKRPAQSEWFPAPHSGACGSCGEWFDKATLIRFIDKLLNPKLGGRDWIAECCADIPCPTDPGGGA